MNTAFISAFPVGGGPVPLGVLILLWQKNEFLDKCNKCGGIVNLLGWGGSVLSGTHERWGICRQCGDFISQGSIQGTMIRVPESYWDLRRKYRNEDIIQRGKRKRFDWGKGLVGEDTPDIILKSKVEGVSMKELIENLSGETNGK